MIVVCQVNRSNNTHYEGTKREFEELTPALEYLFVSYKNMYGTEADIDYEFWDPKLQDKSSQLYSVELFLPGEDDGWYLFRNWEKVH